jgi:hypothetical protein
MADTGSGPGEAGTWLTAPCSVAPLQVGRFHVRHALDARTPQRTRHIGRTSRGGPRTPAGGGAAVFRSRACARRITAWVSAGSRNTSRAYPGQAGTDEPHFRYRSRTPGWVKGHAAQPRPTHRTRGVRASTRQGPRCVHQRVHERSTPGAHRPLSPHSERRLLPTLVPLHEFAGAKNSAAQSTTTSAGKPQHGGPKSILVSPHPVPHVLDQLRRSLPKNALETGRLNSLSADRLGLWDSHQEDHRRRNTAHEDVTAPQRHRAMRAMLALERGRARDRPRSPCPALDVLARVESFRCCMAPFRLWVTSASR